jgi:molecular chaperone GrpE
MTKEKNNNIEDILPETTVVENDQEQNATCNNQDDTKILELEKNNQTLSDQLLRLAAELENTRKRNREEIDKTNKYAISNFANDLVLVVENFYLASDNLPQEEIDKLPIIKHFVDAMLMTKKELTKILEKYGVKRIYPFGEKFDHNYHEAISQTPATGDEEDGIVKQVIQAGYSIGDRLIKPSLVVVSTKN